MRCEMKWILYIFLSCTLFSSVNSNENSKAEISALLRFYNETDGINWYKCAWNLTHIKHLAMMDSDHGMKYKYSDDGCSLFISNAGHVRHLLFHRSNPYLSGTIDFEYYASLWTMMEQFQLTGSNLYMEQYQKIQVFVVGILSRYFEYVIYEL
eukprot:439326_1